MRTFGKWAAMVVLALVAAAMLVPDTAWARHLASDGYGWVLPIFIGATVTLGNYNEIFFAQEALIQLEKALGIAGRVHRGYSPEPVARGDTVRIRRPSTFVAANAPAAASDVATDSVTISLNKWKEVKFGLTDKDLSLSAPQIISDHIRPAAVALADVMDQDLAGLYTDVPWKTTFTATPVLADLGGLRQVMFDNKVPLKDPAMLHAMVGSTEELEFLKGLAASGMQPRQQDPSLRDGSMGRLFGFDVFANQNIKSHTSGVSADATGAVNNAAGYAKGATVMAVDGLTISGTFKIGDSFSIAGHTQRYVFTADETADGGGAIAALDFAPGLEAAVADNDVVTIFLGGAAKRQNLAWHRNAFALATAPLSELGGQLGARIVTVNDPITNLSLRSRMYYDGDNSQVKVALDVLYGFVTLDRNLAVRGYQA